MRKYIYLTTLAVVFLVGGFIISASQKARAQESTAPVAETSAKQSITLNFGHFWDVGKPEQDVFVEQNKAGFVFRVYEETLTSALKLKTLFSAKSASEVAAATDPLGPFAKGRSLEMTLGAWLAAKGTAAYVSDGTTATTSFSFENLKPRGIYTIWCGTMSASGDVKMDLALCAPQTKPVSKAADSKGSLSMTLALKPLAMSTASKMSVVVLLYHNQGVATVKATQYLGEASHRQLFALMPSAPTLSPEATAITSAPAEVTPEPSATATPVAPASGYSSSIWLIIGLAVVILLVLAVILA